MTGASFNFCAFFTLAGIAAAVVGLAFGPFLVAAALHAGKTAALAQFQQILSRLFPFQRGLCHAYWAPNVWALYNVADKALQIVCRWIPGLRSLVKTSAGASMTGGLVEVASHAVLPSVLPGHTFI